MGARLIVLPPRLPFTGDLDTVASLVKLLTDARHGEVIGFAYVALRPNHEDTADVMGTALQSPLLCRGICRALEDAVAAGSKKP